MDVAGGERGGDHDGPEHRHARRRRRPAAAGLRRGGLTMLSCFSLALRERAGVRATAAAQRIRSGITALALPSPGGRGFLAVGVAVLLSLPAGAQTLRVRLSAETSSADPHHYALTPNTTLRAHIYDGLVSVDPELKIKPGLATSWERTD